MEGIHVGPVNYSLFVNQIGTSAGGGNDLISSPVAQAEFNKAFVITNSEIPVHPTRRGEFAFAPYSVENGATKTSISITTAKGRSVWPRGLVIEQPPNWEATSSLRAWPQQLMWMLRFPEQLRGRRGILLEIPIPHI